MCQSCEDITERASGCEDDSNLVLVWEQCVDDARTMAMAGHEVISLLSISTQ